MQARLATELLHVEGDPALPISSVGIAPGSAGLTEQVLALNLPGGQVRIASEASEWEIVKYVRDAIAQGPSKALILLGHEV